MIKILLAIIIVEAITEILVNRSITENFRNSLKVNFLKQLFNCGACTSVWLSILISYLIDLRLNLFSYDWLYYVEPFFLAFVVHRGATWFHQLYRAFRNGPQITINHLQTTQQLTNNGKTN